MTDPQLLNRLRELWNRPPEPEPDLEVFDPFDATDDDDDDSGGTRGRFLECDGVNLGDRTAIRAISGATASRSVFSWPSLVGSLFLCDFIRGYTCYKRSTSLCGAKFFTTI